MKRNLENIEDKRVGLVVAKTSIMSNSGIEIDYLNPTEDMFCIEDIATGLSNVARFTGQTSRHYSVAQHSVLGSTKFNDPWKALGFLLHDAHEAYMQDLPSPLKELLSFKKIREVVESLEWFVSKYSPDSEAADIIIQDLKPLLLTDYKTIANGIQQCIERKFGVYETMTIHHEEMKDVDYRIYTTERRDLHPWYDISKYPNHPPYDDIGIFQWPPEMALYSFMNRFRQLKKKMQEVAHV